MEIFINYPNPQKFNCGSWELQKDTINSDKSNNTMSNIEKISIKGHESFINSYDLKKAASLSKLMPPKRKLSKPKGLIILAAKHRFRSLFIEE